MLSRKYKCENKLKINYHGLRCIYVCVCVCVCVCVRERERERERERGGERESKQVISRLYGFILHNLLLNN